MEKKKTTITNKKKNTPKVPTLAERITDFSTNSLTNVRYIPKKKK